MKKAKKILSLCTAFSLVLSTLALTVSADNGIDYDTGDEIVTDVNFEFPDGFEDADYVNIDMTKPANDAEESAEDDFDCEFDERPANEVHFDTKGESTYFGVPSNTDSLGDGWQTYTDRQDDTVNGEVDTYYRSATGDEVTMFNVYTAAKDGIMVDSVSYYLDAGTSGYVDIYVYSGYDSSITSTGTSAASKTLGLDKYLHTYSYNAYAYNSDDGYYTTNLGIPLYSKNGGMIKKGEKYAIAVTTGSKQAYATHGSLGTGTSYVFDSEKCVDLAEDNMRAAFSATTKAATSSSYTSYVEAKVTNGYPYYLNGSKIINSAPTLSWQGYPGSAPISFYRIYRITDDGNVRSDYELIKSTTGTTFTDTTAKAGMRYTYKVVGCSADKKEGYTNAVSVMYTNIAPTSNITVTPSKTIKTEKYVEFDAVPGASYYYVFPYSADPNKYTYYYGTNDYTGVSSTGKSRVQASIRNYNKTTDKYVIVAAGNLNGAGKYFCTLPSAAFSIAGTSEPVYKSFTAEAANSGVRLNWSFTNATDYTVEKRESSADYITLEYTANSFYIDTDVIPGKTYVYSVTANNRAYGTTSKEVTVTVPQVTTPAVPKMVYSQTYNEGKYQYFDMVWEPVSGASDYLVFISRVWKDVENGKKVLKKTTPTAEVVSKNWFKASSSLSNELEGIYYYIVARDCKGNKIGSPKAVYFGKSKFWISATTTITTATLKWNPDYNQDEYAYIYRSTKPYGPMQFIGSTTDSTYVDKTIKAGTTYYYMVCTNSYTSDIRAAISNTASSVVMKEIKPLINSVSISWHPVKGATKYAVYSYLDGKYTAQGTTTDTVYTVKNLVNGKRYGFLVRAYVNGAWTSYTQNDLRYATPVAYASKPIISSVEAGDKKVTVNWHAVDGATKYNFYSYDPETSKYTLRGSVTGTSYIAANLTNGKRYGFLVRAFANGAWSSYTADDVVYATPKAAEALASPKVYIDDNYDWVDLSWNYVYGASKYYVYSYVNDSYKLLATTTNTSYTVKNLTPGVKYGFLVRASVNGKLTSFSTDDLVYTTVQKTESPNFSVSAGDTTAHVQWEYIDGATSYAVYTYLNGKYTLAGSTTSNFMDIKNLSNNIKYGFIVRAKVNGSYTAFTDDDIAYVTPVKQVPVIASVEYDGDRKMTAVDFDTLSGATKYNIYTYANGQYTLEDSVYAGEGGVAYINAKPGQKNVGIIIRAYLYGAWTSFSASDVSYYDIEDDSLRFYGNSQGKDKLYVYWYNGPVNATKYYVYTYNPTTKNYKLEGTTSSTSFTITNITNIVDDYCYYLVRSYANGKLSDFTEGDIKRIYMYDNSFHFYASSNNAKTIDVSWNRIDNATKYYIYTYDYNTKKYTLINSTAADKYTITGLTSGSTVGVLVRASVNGTMTSFTESDIRRVTVA